LTFLVGPNLTVGFFLFFYLSQNMSDFDEDTPHPYLLQQKATPAQREQIVTAQQYQRPANRAPPQQRYKFQATPSDYEWDEPILEILLNFVHAIFDVYNTITNEERQKRI
jgi:hypothetical protein